MFIWSCSNSLTYNVIAKTNCDMVLLLFQPGRPEDTMTVCYTSGTTGMCVFFVTLSVHASMFRISTVFVSFFCSLINRYAEGCHVKSWKYKCWGRRNSSPIWGLCQKNWTYLLWQIQRWREEKKGGKVGRWERGGGRVQMRSWLVSHGSLSSHVL